MQEPSSPKLQRQETGEEEKEGVWSEMLALRQLYRFLRREGKEDHTSTGEEKLDGTSRLLLKKLLDDATRQVIQSQDKPFLDSEPPPMATSSTPTDDGTKETPHSIEHQACDPNATAGVAETAAPKGIPPILEKTNDHETNDPGPEPGPEPEPEPARLDSQEPEPKPEKLNKQEPELETAKLIKQKSTTNLDPKQVGMDPRRPPQHCDHLHYGPYRHHHHHRPSQLILDMPPTSRKVDRPARHHSQLNRSSHLERNKSESTHAKSKGENRRHKSKPLFSQDPTGGRTEKGRVQPRTDVITDSERTVKMGDGLVHGNHWPRVKSRTRKSRARLAEDTSSSRSKRSFSTGSESFGSFSTRGRDRIRRSPHRTASLRRTRLRSPSLPSRRERHARAASRCESLPPQRTRLVGSRSFKFRGKGYEGKEEENKGGKLRQLKDKLAVIFHHHHYHHHHHHHHNKDGEHHHRFSRLLRKLIHRKGAERHAMEMHGEHEAERRGEETRGHGHFRMLVQGLMQHLRMRREKRRARKERERMLKDGAARLHGGRDRKRLHWWQKLRRLGGVKLTRRKKPRLMLGPGTGRRPQRKLLRES